MHLYIEKEEKWDNMKKLVILQGNFIKIFMLLSLYTTFLPLEWPSTTKFYTFMERFWPEERLSDCKIFFLAFPLKKKADEWKMFQSNEMLANQYFFNILGNWPAARVKIIQKEPLWTNFDLTHRNLEYHDYYIVLLCILFRL